MHILVDYRPALRERTGVGQYVHEVTRALVASSPSGETLSLFSSSWKDRLEPSRIPGAHVIDRRVPVRVLDYVWHRWGWPPVEMIAGGHFDVAQSLHPLLIPATSAAQIVTIHDLDFLDHPERTRAEIRRDYGEFAAAHAQRADRVITVSAHTASEITRRLDVPREKISICIPGAPDWPRRTQEPVPGCVLFVGTLEPRKNVGLLLDAYAEVVTKMPSAPQLVLAGRITAEAADWIAQTRHAPLAGHVDVLGYVSQSRIRSLYESATVFVLPSHHEGFGTPALEAMTIGVPVIASARGALPEVLGDAGILVDPEDATALAARLLEVLDDRALRGAMRTRGWERAARHHWRDTANATREAWTLAFEARQRRG